MLYGLRVALQTCVLGRIFLWLGGADVLGFRFRVDSILQIEQSHASVCQARLAVSTVGTVNGSLTGVGDVDFSQGTAGVDHFAVLAVCEPRLLQDVGNARAIETGYSFKQQRDDPTGVRRSE